MRINKKTAGYSALGIVAFFTLLILALPPLIKHFAVQQIDQATGRKSRIDKISLNPFTLSAGISGVRLSEKGSDVTFLSLSSARLSLSPLSLPKRSFIISELKLSSPYLHVVRNAPNSFNFTDLLVQRPGKKEQKKEGTPLFSVNNITLSNGSIDFQDKALSVEKFHRVRDLAIAVPFVSNMPYLADRYVKPHFGAVVNGSPVRFEGQLKPLTRAIEATIDLNVERFDLPYYLGYVPFPLPVKVNSGRLDSELVLGYRVDEKTGPEFRVAGALTLSKIAVSENTGASLAALERAHLDLKSLLVYSRYANVSSLELDGMELYASRDRLGVWNFQKLGHPGQAPKPAAATDKPEPQKAGKKAAFDLKLVKFSFKGGKLHFADAVPKGGFKTDLHDIDLNLAGFSLDEGHKAPFDLKLKSLRGETVALKGELTAAPLDLKASLALNGVPLKDYYPYLADTLSAPVTGTLGVTSEIIFNESQGLVLEKSSLKAADLAAPFGGGDGFRLKLAQVTGVRVDLKQRKALVEKVDLSGGKFILTGEKDGTVSALRLLRPQKAPAAAKVQKTPKAKKTAKGKEPVAPPFAYRIEKIVGSDLGIKYTDRTKEDEPAFTLNRMKFSVAGIAGPKQGPIPLTLATGFGAKGQISAAGTLTPQPLKFKGNVELQRIALRDFDPYIPENTNIFIADGNLSTKLALNVEKAASGIKGTFNGAIGVQSFYCQETILDEDLLKWESLQIGNVNGTLGPFTLAVKDVVLNNFYSRIIVQKDGTLNVQHLVGEEPQAAQAKPAPQAASAATAAAKAAPTATGVTPQAKSAPAAAQVATAPKPAPAGNAAASKSQPAQSAAATPAAPAPSPISIDAITLQGGTMDFTDQHLKTPFDTTFFNLGGRISGLSSQATRMAEVDLRGNLENHSPLSITGTINPLRGDLFLDLKVSFNDIELSPFTPYSDTYLGFNVDKGKLFLDLTYHIEKKSLSSTNKVFIDQFTFGKQVESDKATKLPVRLAIALLKDRKGEIHLDLPVTGKTDDPQFSVWRVVVQILKNLLVKAATSPFALLGSMFGGNHDFSAVYFASGSDELIKAEQDKLAKLSEALRDRPALNLEISGFVDRIRDAEGYRNELLMKKMKGEKFRALAKQGKNPEGQTPEKMTILPDEYHTYLKAVYQKEKFPKPRNALGIVKDLPDEEMKKLIITHTVVGENEMQSLARERAETVKAFLQKEGGIHAERLFEKSADIYKPNAKEGSSASRVEFGASVK
jgi:flagellar motor protein MotB